MTRLLLIAALLVASVAPAWAQSDSRWIAVFKLSGYAGKGYLRSAGGGDRTTAWMAQTHHIADTILDRTGTPYKVFSLPDSASWGAIMGTTRINGSGVAEADSTWFRRSGCMGWIMCYEFYSSSFDGFPYSAEGVAYFTGSGTTKGTFACGPMSGAWGIPGVVFTGGSGTATNSGQGFFNGMVSSSGPTGTDRVRQAFANGDSISMQIDRMFRISPVPTDNVNVTPIIFHGDTLNATGYDVAAWKYKTNCTYYSVFASGPYGMPTPIMLAVAGIFNDTGYRVKRKLNLHIDLDHPFPDSRPSGIPTAPSDSFFKYMDAHPEWRHGSAIEAHSTEIADDDPVLAATWKSRSAKWPAHPHSHQYLNFGTGDGPGTTNSWNLTTFADSATKRARWNDMETMISDTLGFSIPRGYERTATFPNNDVNYPDLYIMATAGFTDIRAKSLTPSDTMGAPPSLSLKRWKRVTGPRRYSNPMTTYGLPYAYIDNRSNKLLYIHDSSERPTSSDTLYVTGTNYTIDMEGFADRCLSDWSRAAIWDAGAYWHPDMNVGNGRFMADFYRRLTYFYNRVSNIMEITPVYYPKTPRKGGGTSRSSYSNNR